MNKFLIGSGVFLWSILIIVNYATWFQDVHIIIWYANPWVLSIVGIWIWAMFWFWLKGFLEDKYSNKDDEWLHF